MTEINPATWFQNRTDHSAQGERLRVLSQVRSPGRREPADLLISPNSTPNMTVAVAAGSCFVLGTEAIRQGMYHCVNDGAVSLTITPSSTTQNRKDIVIAEVQDAFYSGTENRWRLRVVPGAYSSGTAIEPTVPQNSIKLGTVDVPANKSSITSADIINKGPVMQAQLPHVATSAELTRVDPALGQWLFEEDIAAPVYWNGTAWVSVGNDTDLTWQTYTPTVYVGGGAISVGNGTVRGRYMRRGKSVLFEALFLLGSTTSYLGNSGAIGFSVPFPIDLTWTALLLPVGHFRALGPNPGGYHGLVVQNATPQLNFLISTGPGGAVASADSYVLNTTITSTNQYIVMQAEYPRA